MYNREIFKYWGRVIELIIMGRTKGSKNKATLERMQCEETTKTGYASVEMKDGVAVPTVWPKKEKEKAVKKIKSIEEIRNKLSTEGKRAKVQHDELEEDIRKDYVEASNPKILYVPTEPSSKKKPTSKDEPPLEFNGVTSRVDHPKVPECLVDGGMLYRWLNDVRKTYIEEKVDKKEIKIINEIMDYIMRMEKKQSS